MKVKKSLIVVNSFKEESKTLGAEIQAYLKNLGIQADIFVFNGFSEQYPFYGYDFVITMGGDGTVLFAARGCAPMGIPIFPVNFGSFGFIASVQRGEWKKELDDFLAGNSVIDERSMLRADLIRGGQRRLTATGLNDIVICGKTAAHTISFNVLYDKVPLGEIKADGIIISTATGSTAYSASAGGPIIDPGLDAMVLTLMNAFSLSSRPLVLSPDGSLEIEILPSRISDVVISVDGQIPVDLHVGDVIRINQIDDKAKLIGCTKEKFYNALRSKLNWSGGPQHA
ncbi:MULTISPECIES: NAD(+)/NADH kinase [unclassified Treponema]|uniref:NAD(+)/NADH kinase n=1 Tax=unclassified Treponema TaxID=2638727 RepID=UPI001B19B6B9|nr:MULTISPECIES: NAD(+)/NADH kinase [unclassified Treponema]MBO6218313.1 NAD(+)/NADH kinase [Treponema sp.]MBQ8679005.1 NAD(+)/NADH kinase [Treponema sp.]